MRTEPAAFENERCGSRGNGEAADQSAEAVNAHVTSLFTVTYKRDGEHGSWAGMFCGLLRNANEKLGARGNIFEFLSSLPMRANERKSGGQGEHYDELPETTAHD